MTKEEFDKIEVEELRGEKYALILQRKDGQLGIKGNKVSRQEIIGMLASAYTTLMAQQAFGIREGKDEGQND